ncbi:MAG: DUF6273 domain-containing protein [Roseburia sp.]|nr:DUF6273 domain-containing protein [Roseburia sp.]
MTGETAEVLIKMCGKPDIKRGSLWHDYNYPVGSGMYADIEYSGRRYRVVYRKKHRESKISYEYAEYRDNNFYAFIFEPIMWRVLKTVGDTALLVSAKLLDAQEFFAGEKRKIGDQVIYMNNYEYSYVRRWLNDMFFVTAFNDSEKSFIKTTSVCNAPQTTKKAPNPYCCSDTEDNVFLLSFEEAKTLFVDNKDRWKKATEYTKSQGCLAYKTHDAKFNNAGWWLRSPDHKYENCVRCVGYGGGMGDGGFSCANEPTCALEAIAPALCIKIR